MEYVSFSSGFIDVEDLCVKAPLYSRIEFLKREENHPQEKDLYDFITGVVRLDSYCPQCKDSSIFASDASQFYIPWGNFLLRSELRIQFMKRFRCTRVPAHEILVYFHVENLGIEKIGQFPSISELDEGQLKHYRPVLEKKQFTELNRAVGLASHGVGIGSFVYLRRIFEDLVEAAHGKAIQTAGWDETSYIKARMDEKIRLLKNELPEFLYEQRAMYGILSKGVHSLDEDECLTYFPVIRAGIELILDQALALEKQRKKLEEAKKNIAGIAAKVSQPRNAQ